MSDEDKALLVRAQLEGIVVPSSCCKWEIILPDGLRPHATDDEGALYFLKKHGLV